MSAQDQSRDREGAHDQSRDRDGAHDQSDDQSRDREGATTHALKDPVTNALAYFITYHTYGTWLHGDRRGSVDPEHNAYGAPPVAADARREAREQRRAKAPLVHLNDARRDAVACTIEDVCEFRRWTLHAASVRSNHFHVVLSAPARPEKVMNDLKSWSTRRLVEAGLLERGSRAWTRHGSTRYLWKRGDLLKAVEYVLDGQGPDLARGVSLPDGRGSDLATAPRRDVDAHDQSDDQSRDRQGAHDQSDDQSRDRQGATAGVEDVLISDRGAPGGERPNAGAQP